MAGATPGADGRAAPSALSEEPADWRFALHDEDGVAGVLDRAGPQIYFAESRDQALHEVARANDIVARYPNTVSMRHLREMDAEWRSARGLPALPAPEGTRVVIQDRERLPGTRAAPRGTIEAPGAVATVSPSSAPGSGAPAADIATPVPEAVGDLTRVVAVAGEVAERRALLARVETLRESARRCVTLAQEVTSAAAAAEQPGIRMRAALRTLYGEALLPEADREARRMLQKDGPRLAEALIRDDPRSLVQGPRHRALANGGEAREHAARQTGAYAPFLGRLERAVCAGAAHVGMEPPQPGRSPEEWPAVLDRLRAMHPVHESAVAQAAASYRRRAAGLKNHVALGKEWATLGAAERAAVARAYPEIAQLVQPARAVRRARGPDMGT